MASSIAARRRPAWLDDIRRMIDDKRNFSVRNISDTVITVTAPVTPNEEFRVEHQCETVPYHFLVVSLDKNGTVYWGDRTADKTNAWLKCSASGMKVKIVFF